jgi:pyridoxamine 5'-phosphate oxidase
MSLAPWRSPLSRALHRNRRQTFSRYPQLATVRPNGRPANRTVVFRHFLDDTNGLLFVTDQRSEKIEHLAHNPAAELCWYFAHTREQFRLSGEMALLDATCTDPETLQIRQAAWATLSDNARQQFIWPAPGQPRGSSGYAFVDNLDEQSPPTHLWFSSLSQRPSTISNSEARPKTAINTGDRPIMFGTAAK